MSAGIKRDFDAAVRECIAAMSERLANGTAADYPEYCRGAGKIRGLRKALDIFGDVYDKYTRTDEEGDEDGD